MGWSLRLVLVAGTSMLSARALDLSGRVAGAVAAKVVVPSPGLCDDTLESRLFVDCRPILPSFSTATKLVRTLESGRGDPEPSVDDQVDHV